MQKKVLTTASMAVLLAGLSGTAMVAHANDVTVYGKALLTVQNSEKEASAEESVELKSNASRLGFKGEAELDGGLKAVYKLEYEVAVDDGKDVFSQRNIYAGIKGDFGQVIAGKFDTPFKASQGKIDLFNDLSGDLKAIFYGENRASNILQYTTPKFGAVAVNVAAVLSEKNDSVKPATEEDGVSISGVYKQGDLYVALAIDRGVGKTQEKDNTVDSVRVVGQYQLGGLLLGAMVQNSESSNPLLSGVSGTETGAFVSVAYKTGKTTWKVQTGSTDEKAKGNSQTSLGVDYKLGKKTKIFGFITDRTQDAAKSDDSFAGFGLEHKF